MEELQTGTAAWVASAGAHAELPPAKWCVHERPFALDARIHRAFEAWAARTPDALAAIDGERRLTYRELNARGNRLARALQSRGVAPGSCVGLCAERSLELIVGQLAILKAGAAYVPIETAYPEARMRVMIEDTAARLVLTQRALVASLPPLGAEVLCLDEAWADDPAWPAENLAVEVPPDAPAHVIFTSGSTGRPKGVEVLHHGVVRLTDGQSYVSMSPADRMLVNASPAFDGITFEVWVALHSGAACVVNADRRIDFARLEALVRTHGVTHTFITTSLFNQIVDLRPQTLATLREIHIGGEALSVAHIRRAREAMPGVVLNNSYGPTEGTTFVTSYRIAAPEAWGCASVPIGTPLAHSECHVVDESLRRLAVGETGELLIGGPGVARGYRNLPALTAERFVRPPWSTPGAGHYYRTGDLARWLPNGLIEYLGRADEQVKVRGYRLELGEVETAARSCPGVAEAAAAVRTLGDGRKQIVLFVVGDGGGARRTTAQLRADLQTRLLEAAMPGLIEWRERLPLTTSGKMDRRALLAELAARDTAAVESTERATLPRQSCELAQLAEIWRKTLGRPELGSDSCFLQAGGDSLLAVQLALEVERALGWRVPVASVFEFTTPLALWAAHTRAEAATAHLSGSGDGPPFFFFPTVSGIGRLPPGWADEIAGVARYYDRFVYPGVDGRDTPLESVEAIAAQCCRELEAIQPDGPVSVGGLSFGGVVAFEAACQLAERGRQVRHVVLGDSNLASAERWRGRWERILVRVVELFRPPWRATPERLRLLWRLVQRKRGLADPEDAWSTPVSDACCRAFFRYEARRYPGDVTLLYCTRSPVSPHRKIIAEDDYDWGDWVDGRFTVRRVAHAHMDLFEGHGRKDFGAIMRAR